MHKGRTSIIWKINKEEFNKVCKSKPSLADILRHFGLHAGAGNYKTLKKRIEEDEIDISHIQLGLKANLNREPVIKYKKKEDVLHLFCENGKDNRFALKKFIRRFDMLDDHCQKCGLGSEWQGEEISLQLDHINGVNNDNRIENLRFLCPNCHSQTTSFNGKNKKNRYNCSDCGKEVTKEAKRCTSCSSIHAQKDKCRRPEKHILKSLVWEKPCVKIAKDFDVSDSVIGKWCKFYDIDKPPRGYWAKKDAGTI